MKKLNTNKGKKHVLGIVLGTIVLFLLIVYFSFSMYFRSHFLFRTTINGVESSCRTAAGVEDELTDEINSYVLTILERNNGKETINGQDISISPQYDGTIEELLKNQNAFGWIVSIFKQNTYTIETMVSYDEDALMDALSELDCMNSENAILPENAEISDYSSENGYQIIPAEYGTLLNEEVFKETIKDAISKLEEEVSLDEKKCYNDPEITEETQSLKDAVDTLNQYVNAKITYDFGDEREVLDASSLNEWLSVSDELEVIISEDELAAYVKNLASKYNTAGQAKTLITESGTSVTVPGGSYGWKIDQAAEQEQLLSDIKKGEIIEREPNYSQTANSHGENDYGNTYVEINLTAQHLNFYKNGALIISTDFVSGSVAAEHDTPTGAYFVNSRETERILRGEDYETFVNYWMPFNGGVGMHDATWRSNFGGTIYLRNGSHGCINLPLSAAKTIYSNIEVGDPVLVYRTEPTPVVVTTVAPETIIAEIDSIGPVTLESETIMTTIRTQYDALSAEDKAKVTNYNILVEDEAALAALKAAAGLQ